MQETGWVGQENRLQPFPIREKTRGRVKSPNVRGRRIHIPTRASVQVIERTGDVLMARGTVWNKRCSV